MNEWKAVIFDMDGLLVDTEPIWGRAETALIKARGHVFDAQVRKKIMGLRIDSILRVFADHYKLSDDIPALASELIRRMLDIIDEGVVAMPGADDLLDFLVENDIPCAIASSSSMPLIEAVVTNRGWLEAFPTRCSADSVPNGKPAPDVYLLAAQTLGFDPAHCLALEDSPTGARAAVAAGMVCYAVPDRSHAKASDFADITPHVFASLHDVLADLRVR
jgi:HAD superfamily hydrolase (TIGR01509 family)